MRVEVFGGLKAVRDNGTEITHFRTRQCALLLARLAFHPGQMVSRASLRTLLWPEGDDNFNWVLARLSNDLGEGWIVKVGHREVGLSDAVTSDLYAFDIAYKAALTTLNKDKIAAVLELAKGELLPGFEDSWVETEREIRQQQEEELQKRLRAFESLDSLGERRTIAGKGFFGREKEIKTLQSFSEAILREGSSRLLTITGTGGMGKTRLMREALLDRALCYLPLIELDNASAIFDRLRELLKLPATGFGPVNERVIAHLNSHNKPLLLLDNAEHITEEVKLVVQEILASCPKVRIVVTSRRRLKIENETRLPLETLTLSTAETLFLDRAHVVSPTFGTTPVGKKQVTEICSLLEGIPLALEIAAARANLVSPKEMCDELERRLRFLNTQRSQGESQHHSVQTALKWSYDLLTPPAQSAFRATGVFRGGFTLPAIRFVWGDDPPALDMLEELTLHSLLKADSPESSEKSEEQGVRYYSLETIRELAELLLKKNLTELARCQDYHTAYYLDEARKIADPIEQDKWVNAANTVRAERANFHVVLSHSIRGRNLHTLTDLVKSLTLPYLEIGYWQEVDSILDAAEDMLAQTSIFVNVLIYRAVIARRRGDSETAWQAWQRVYQIYEQNNNTKGMFDTRIELASQAIEESRQEAYVLVQKLVEENNKTHGSVTISLRIATLHAQALSKTDNISETRLQANKALDIIRNNPQLPPRSLLVVIFYLCPIFRSLQAWMEVQFLVANGFETSLDARQFLSLGSIFTEIGHLYLAKDDFLTAIQAFWASQEIHREIGSRFAHESEQVFLETQEQYKHLPEVKEWLETRHQHQWQDLAKTKFLPAHDLHTFVS